MGIGGHVLGPAKLRRLQRDTGLPFDRAYLRGSAGGEGVIWTPTGCEHYEIDRRTWAVEKVEDPTHWTTCNPANRPTENPPHE